MFFSINMLTLWVKKFLLVQSNCESLIAPEERNVNRNIEDKCKSAPAEHYGKGRNTLFNDEG